jgi:trehalose 6-phosphate phosphatase
VIRILAKDNRDLLRQIAWSQVLLAFDFDGTLAPIVADRDAAEMRKDTAQLLHQLCKVYPVAVISGRSQSDVRKRLDGAPVKYVVGNHGLEPGGDLPAIEDQVLRAKPLLDSALADISGVEIEDKRYSLAVHYRRARNKRLARAAIDRAVTLLPVPMRVVLGKLVVNILPAGAPNKGDALLELRRVENAATALYLGDDVTDEDIFQLDQPGRLFSVRIGESAASAAKYYLRDQREMDALMKLLYQARAGDARND